MAANSRDVELVVRARDEASKGIKSIGDALEALTKIQESAAETGADLGNSLDATGKRLQEFEIKAQALKALGGIVSDLDKMAGSVERLGKQFADNSTALEATKGKIDALSSSGKALEASVGQTKAAFEQEQAAVQRLQERLEQLKTEINAATAAKRALNEAGANSKKASDDDKAAYAAQVETLKTLRAERETLRTQLKSEKDALAPLRDAYDAANKALRENTTELTKQQNVLQNNETRLKVTADNLTKVKEVYQETKQAAEGMSSALNVPLNKEAISGAASGAKDQAASLRAFQTVQDRLDPLSVLTRKYNEDLAALRAGLATTGASEEATAGAVAKLTTEFERQKKALADSTPEAKAAAQQAEEARKTAEAQAVAAKKDAEAKAAATKKAAEDEANAFRMLQDRLNPVAALTRRYNDELATLRAGMTASKASADQLAAAEAKLGAEYKRNKDHLESTTAGGSKPSFMGMKPYELTNLGYQINDVVSGFASGQRPMQIFAQQGGQILQLMPQVGEKIFAVVTNLRLLGTVAAIAAPLIILAEAIKKVADQADRMRDMNRLLSFSPDAGQINVAQIEKAADTLHGFGISAKEAHDAFKVFIAAGFDPSAFVRLTVAAKGLSDATGKDLKESVQTVSEAFSGGANKVLEFDRSFKFLSPTQRQHIVDLKEQGKNVEAVNYAFGIFSQEAAKVEGHLSPLTRLTNDLSAAWNSFLTYLGNSTPIKAAAGFLNSLADAADRIVRSLSGVSSRESLLGDIGKWQEQISQVEGQKAQAEGNGQTNRVALLNNQLETLRANLREARKALDDLDKQQGNTGGAGGIVNPNAAISQADVDRLSKFEREQRLAQLQRSRDNTDQISKEETLLRLTQARQAASEQISNLQVKDDARMKRDIDAAVQAEQEKINKENKAAREAAHNERETAIGRFTQNVIGAEGGTGQNPNSSAAGYGQFTNSTWLSYYKRLFPERSAGMSDEQILAERFREAPAKAIIGTEARDSAKRLESAGHEVTAGNLYMAHFLGNAGALKVLGANPNTSLEDLIGNEALNANKSSGYTWDKQKQRWRTAGELKTFLAGRMGDKTTTGDMDPAVSSAEVDFQQRADELAAAQGKANRALEDRSQILEEQTRELQKQSLLQDMALLNAQKHAAGEKAVNDAIRERNDQNEQRKEQHKDALPTLTKDSPEMAVLRKMVEDNFSAQHLSDYSQALTNKTLRPVNDLTAKRDSMMAQLQAARANGQSGLADTLVPEIEAANTQLEKAIDFAISFYQELDPKDDPLHRTREQLDALIARLRQSKIEAGNLKTGVLTASEVNHEFAAGATGAVMALGKGLGAAVFGVKSLGGAFREAKDAFLNFAASFLEKIAAMILQAQLLKLMESIPGVGSLISDSTKTLAAIHHSGGIVGSGGASRHIPMAAFNNAIRYHTGGMAGLNANEVPAILQKNEEVLTTADPRHRWNMGAANNNSAGQQQDIKIVNAIDTGHMLSEAMNTTHGQRAIVNFIRSNARAVNTALKG